MSDPIPFPHREREGQVPRAWKEGPEPWNRTANYVAWYLGLSREAVYRIPARELPRKKVCGRLRFRQSDIESYGETEGIEGAA